MMKPFALLIFCCLCVSAFAQPNTPPASASDIYQSIKKLKVLGSVLYIAAHPDDENTKLLTYFSKEKLYKTGYLSLTRGDGGQNLIGDEQGIALGLIRTQELLSARKIDGASQFFTTAFDFGYSKTPDETLEKWNKEKILGDVVWIIRTFKPDVIITRFPVTGEGGHGHHTASAILAEEAFSAAADSSRFPEQLSFTQVWQPKRLLWNTFNFGSVNTQSSNQFNINAGGFNAMLGRSYGEIAADSRSQHRSQGFGVSKTRGESKEYFVQMKGEDFKDDIFENVNTSWDGIAGGSAVETAIDSLLGRYDFSRPEASVKSLLHLYNLIEATNESRWKQEKLTSVKNIIAAASGLWFEAYCSSPFVAQGDSMQLNFTINDRAGAGFLLNQIRVHSFDSVFSVHLPSDKNFSFSAKLWVPPNYPVTQPYWLQKPMDKGSFHVTDQRKIGQPDVDAAFTAQFEIEISGRRFSFTAPVFYKYTDPVKGEKYQPFIVVPRVTLSAVKDIQIVNAITQNKTNGRLTALSNATDNNVVVRMNDSVLFQSQTPMQKNESADITYPISIDKHASQKLNIFSVGNEPNPAMVLHRIEYDHIPFIQFFTEAKTQTIAVNVKTAGRNIGYIQGAGDKVPDALQQMGYKVTMLSADELTPAALKKFDAIITGIRAYNTNEWLDKYYPSLMEYVYNGGNLIVQYNTSNQLGPIKSRIGPYPFNISRTRVTEEDATVELVKPQHRLLNFPNKITNADFEGWIQERSVYHADKWDSRYATIFSMHDRGEAPAEGALITTKYGKGNFTYTGISFFRQLPAGVTGAYRLLANLIALNQKQTKD